MRTTTVLILQYCNTLRKRIISQKRARKTPTHPLCPLRRLTASTRVRTRYHMVHVYVLTRSTSIAIYPSGTMVRVYVYYTRVHVYSSTVIIYLILKSA